MKKSLFVFVIIFGFMFGSCSNNDIGTERLFSELLAVSGESIENNGYTYLSSIPKDDIGGLSEENRKLLYGDSFESSFKKIEEYAIFVSTRGAGELAVFKCHSASDTAEIAKMCFERADSIKITLRRTPYEEKSRAIRVCVSKKFVIMCFVEDGRAVEERFKTLV